MSFATGRTLDALGGFFRWWYAELASLSPPSVRHRAPAPPAPVVVDISASGQAEPLIDSIDRGMAIEIRPHPSQVLTHEVFLPVANRRTTGGMVDIQMRRVLPLKMSDLFTDWRGLGTITSSHDGATRQKVRLFAVKRRVFGPLFDRIVERGLLVHDVVLESGDRITRLASPDVRRPRNVATLQRVAAGMAVLLAVCWLPYAWVFNVRSENAAVVAELDEIRGDVQEIGVMRDQVDAYRAKTTFLDEQRDADWSVEVLTLLTAESPDTVVLRDLDYEPGRVRLAGTAESAEDWVLRLAGLDGVNDVRLEQVSAARAQSDLQNFGMIIELANRGGR